MSDPFGIEYLYAAMVSPDSHQVWRAKNSDQDVEIISSYHGPTHVRVEFIKNGMYQDLDIDNFRDQYEPYTPMRYGNNYGVGADSYNKDTIKCDCGGHKTYASMEPVYHSEWCKSRN